MNTTKLKSYAPKARNAFIASVTNQAARLGITAAGAETAKVEGDVLLVAGQAFPKAWDGPRKSLAARVAGQGFDTTMDAIAYTWFNRFVAIRYMELHGYLGHGYRVLSHPDDGETQPQILEHAADVDLPGVDPAKVMALKLDGTKDEELYRLLLKAQCNALHQAMPFLFEKIGDETELLLPANLLHTDSLVRQLVTEVEEELWQDIEIIGWLYQFYISEKKDEVIGSVVKSEDIPAATQLFTPNWIVKYMVQNSLGAQWMATYPDSPLKAQMEYYIEPAEQTDEVNAQLAAITPSSLNPEELTLIDPACGSGHILVEAYDLFKAIYLERGYRQKDVAKLILEKNLFGLDIDQRAAQLSGFALMMKGRADDRRLFGQGVKLNVMALVDSDGFDVEGLAKDVKLADYGLHSNDLTALTQLFEYATTFGSLLQVPDGLAAKLGALRQLSEATSQDLFVSEALKRLGPWVNQAEMLTAKYDAVVANPPYMGGKYMSALLKRFAKDYFADAKNDLFACFIERGYTLAKNHGHGAIVTMQSWMFLSSFEQLRRRMLNQKTIRTMTQIGYNSFPSLNSKIAQATVFSLSNHRIERFSGSFINLNLAPQSANKREVFLAKNPDTLFFSTADDFKRVPGSPLAYWMSSKAKQAFDNPNIGSLLDVRAGLTTGNTESFLRYWQEIPRTSIAASPTDPGTYIAYDKGGDFRKWFGNRDYVVAYSEQSLEEMRELPGHRADGINHFFRESITWAKITSGQFSCRFSCDDSGFDATATSAFGAAEDLHQAAAVLNSKVGNLLLNMLNSTIVYLPRDIKNFPLSSTATLDKQHCDALIGLSRTDWDTYERSWDFHSFPLLTASSDRPTLESSYAAWIVKNRETIAEMKRLEEENNRLFIDAYGLADELTPDVPIEQITLTVNPAYRYGGKLTEEQQWTRFREDTMEELVSYAVGCMMGRYSLDEPGLIYANSGNEGFDAAKYPTFPADDDGIVPLSDTAWFDDDACNRLVEFISVAWDKGHLEDNLAFLAANLSPKKDEAPRDTIRRYLSDKFFKSHIKTYKKRPIYWLFSSGKQKAFQGLVYVHRYNEGTLSRMRSEYVIPLQGKMAARIEKLKADIPVATSSAAAKRLEKEKKKLDKQQIELIAFDEKLRHFADKRIALDLDDGVKVNYGKFGDLLSEVKAIHGQKPEEA